MKVQRSNIAIWTAVAGIVAAAVGLPDGAAAQDSASAEAARYVIVRPAFFFSNTDGVTTLGGRPGGSIEMEDSVLSMDWAGQVEYHGGRVGVLGDVSYSTTANTAAFEPSGARTAYDFRILTADLALGYRFGEPDDRAEMMLLLGARYFRTEQELSDSASGAAVASGRDDWLQPLIGARGLVRLARRLEGWTRFDVGVRPVGSGNAAFSWLLHVGLDYWIIGPAGLTLQYRYLQLDTGSPGSRSVAYDGPSQGWIAGLSLRL